MAFLLLIWALDEMHRKGRSVKSKRNVKGFTLIEVLIVISIIAILAAIAIPLYSNIREKAQIAVAISGIKVMNKL
jgi:prepilin-type N-terminal cleavage/methylation domain-containing protein